jgi:hypothetical protein
MSLRFCLGFLVCCLLGGTLTAAEVVINYEFSDEPHVLPEIGQLGSAGGGYWNRVSLNFFGGSNDYDSSAVRDEFGRAIFRDSDPINNFGQQLFAIPRTPQSGPPPTSSVSDASIGSLRWGPAPDLPSSLDIVQLVGTYPDRPYDVAVYYRALAVNGRLALTGLTGGTIDPTVTLPAGSNGLQAAVFTDVKPFQMHLGFPEIHPQGWGIRFVSDSTGSFDLAGIQIRGVIPEPSGVTLACVGIALAVSARRRGG